MSKRLPTRPRCPKCKQLVDGYTPVEAGGIIKPGDIAVCIFCTTPLEFTDKLDFRIIDIHILGYRQRMELRRIVEQIQAHRNRTGGQA